MRSKDLTTVAAALACPVLSGLAVFQGFLVFGAPIGQFAWGGKHRVLPVSLRVGSVVSILIYAIIATVVLARADLVSPGFPEGGAGSGESSWQAAPSAR
jgi:hypothetical protein